SVVWRLYRDCTANASELEKPRKNGFGGVAQLVEQRTFNPLVVGSSPTAFTQKAARLAFTFWLSICFRVRRATPKPFIRRFGIKSKKSRSSCRRIAQGQMAA